jgi:hypothetical protein
MNRNNALVAMIIASGLALGTGCNKNAAREEQEAREAQREATQQTAEAQREATKDTIEAQGKADEAQREANEKMVAAQETARDKTTEAVNSAREETNEAVHALTKQRDDYRQKAQHELDELTASMTDLKAKAAKETGQVQARLAADIRALEVRRAEVERDIAALNTAGTSAELDRLANSLDKRIEDLRDSLRAAEKKI